MVAKVITVGENRQEAVDRMKRALNEFLITGVETTIPFHLNLLNHETFVSGNFNTRFLDLYSLTT